MSGLFGFLLLVGQAQNAPVEDASFVLAQGRASDVERVERAAKRCGIKHTDFSVMQGIMPFGSPDEPEAELSASAASVTRAVRKCIKRSVDLGGMSSELRGPFPRPCTYFPPSGPRLIATGHLSGGKCVKAPQ